MNGFIVTCLCVVMFVVASDVQGAGVPKVRKERPRLFVREKEWDGPAIEKIKPALPVLTLLSHFCELLA